MNNFQTYFKNRFLFEGTEFFRAFGDCVWVQTKEDTETEKFKKVKQLLINSSEDITLFITKTKTWYQVYKPDHTAFGFSVMDGKIKDHPDKRFIGTIFDITKANFEIVKVADQIVL